MQYTPLKDRQLWYDGITVVSPSNVDKAIQTFKRFQVSEMTPEIVQFNRLVDSGSEIKEHSVKCVIPKPEWYLTDESKQINVDDYCCNAVLARHPTIDDSELRSRMQRLGYELKLYKRYGLYPAIQALIQLINNLKRQNVVWGVGRGSSVSSYVLYVIGLHEVDSYKYQLDVTEFLREQDIPHG